MKWHRGKTEGVYLSNDGLWKIEGARTTWQLFYEGEQAGLERYTSKKAAQEAAATFAEEGTVPILGEDEDEDDAGTEDTNTVDLEQAVAEVKQGKLSKLASDECLRRLDLQVSNLTHCIVILTEAVKRLERKIK